jgi:hypothetical protein
VRIGRWHLPKAEMEGLATTVRKVARLLWALHLSFLDGFDEARSSAASLHVPVLPRLLGCKPVSCNSLFCQGPQVQC